MKVRVKNLVLEHRDIQFGVRNDPILTGDLRNPTRPGNFLGNLYVTESGIVWCEGKKAKHNGVKVDWRTFINLMEARGNA
jgi:hypothetical protein